MNLQKKIWSTLQQQSNKQQTITNINLQTFHG